MDTIQDQSDPQNPDVILVQGDVNHVGLATSPTALVQGLNNVQIGVGNVNLVGGNIVHVHHHHHHHYHKKTASQIEIPSLLQQVPNFRDFHSATLGKATAGTGDWIYVWKEFCIWLASDGHLRILWGSGMPGAGKSILVCVLSLLCLQIYS
ncbi:hypothetical protein BKA70DRAFT_1312541, partial [Coprinopsis sp. MPI-PUGE-AT-0042]